MSMRSALLGLMLCASLAHADPGTGIVVLPDGSVVVADPGANRIWRLDASGQAEVLRAETHSHLLRLLADGLIVGEHLVYRRDQEWTHRFWTLQWPERAFRWRTPAKVEASPFEDGLTLHEGPSGDTYSWLWREDAAATQALRRRSRLGQVDLLGTSMWLRSPTAVPDTALLQEARAFQQIVSLAFADSGRMLVVQTDRADWLNQDATVQAAITRAQVPARTPTVPVADFVRRFFGSLVAADGTVLIADAQTRQVIRIHAEGTIDAIAMLDDAYFPVGLATRGNWLYVLEYPDPGLDQPLRVRRMRWAASGQGELLGILQASSGLEPAGASSSD